MSALARRPLASALLGLGMVAALAGCRGRGDGMAGAADPPATATSVPTSVTTTPAPPATSATTVPMTAPSTAAPTTKKPQPPKVIVPRHGGRAYAVFLATSDDFDDPAFAKVHARLASLGYKGSYVGDPGCSQPAPEALPQLKEYAASLEFGTQADADRFAALYGPVMGTVHVTLYCLD